MESLPPKHWKIGIAHGSSANRSRSILFTFIGGGHTGFRANRPLAGNLNLLAMVFENLVSISITMQNFKNLSQSARFCRILIYFSPASCFGTTQKYPIHYAVWAALQQRLKILYC